MERRKLSSGRRGEIFVFCALAAAWLSLYAWISPSFGGVDIFIFKDAGYNLALGHGFKSIPVPFYDGDPELRLFSSYPPIYPLLFGLWGSLLGVGPYSNGYFDLAIGIAASAITLGLLLPFLIQSWARWLAILVSGILAPAGSVFLLTDRPEILAYGLSASLLLFWRQARHSALLSAGCLGGCAIIFLTHPFGGLLMLLILSVLLLTDQTAASARWRILPCGWILFATVCAACAAVFLALDPASLERFAHHAAGSKSGAGLLRSIHGIPGILPFYLEQWKIAFLSSSISSLSMAGSLAASFAIVLPFLVHALKSSGGFRSNHWIIAAFILGLFFLPPLLFPRQNNYYVLTRALIPLLLLSSQTALCARLRQARLPLLLIVAGYLFTLPDVLLQLAERSQNRDSYHENVSKLAAISKTLDPAQAIGISPALYPVIKPAHAGLLNVLYLEQPSQASLLEQLIISRAGTRIKDQAKVPLPNVLQGVAWEPLNRPAPPVFIEFFQKPVMRTQWGWNFDYYRRSPEPR